jgi:hypothetical protein
LILKIQYRLCCHGRIPNEISEAFLKTVPHMIHIQDCQLRVEYKNLSEPYQVVGQDIHIFHNYRSQFVLQNNKYFSTYKVNVNGFQNTLYWKIEYFQKSQKVKLTPISQLNEQIYRTNLHALKQNLYQLMQDG